MTTDIPGKLHVQPDGHIAGPASIEFNTPFPCVNGTPGVTGAMQGVLMHTTVGSWDSCIATFNDPARQASANFVIGTDGRIHQFGPIGKGWMAWHAVAANMTWYGIEHVDDGHPDTPLTQAQITASAQLFEMLSAFCGFPLQVATRVTGRGYAAHFMGGQSWGGHTCPDLPPQHVRSVQRQAIVDLAAQIRHGHGGPPPPAPLNGLVVTLPGGDSRRVISRDGGKTWA